MATVIQLKRGNLSGVAATSAAEGEPIFAKDIPRLYIGLASGKGLLSVLMNPSASADPTVNDDAGDGYSVNSLWTNTTTDKTFICKDATIGAAIWQEINTGTGGITQLTGDVTAGPGSGSVAATVPNDTITYAKQQNVSAASRLLGRGSAGGSGDPEEITVGTGLAMTGTVLSSSVTGGITELTGDVTAGPGSGSQATTIGNQKVTYAKIQNASATKRILARKTAAAGSYEECTLTEVLDMVGAATQGSILYRGASTWDFLAPGAANLFLQTAGAGANPLWASPTIDITALTEDTDFITDPMVMGAVGSDLILVYDTSSAANRKMPSDRLAASVHPVPGGRLSLHATEPLPVGDVTIASGSYVYYHPFESAQLPVPDFTNNGVRTVLNPGFAGTFQSGFTAALPYDVGVGMSEATVSASNTGTDVITLSAATDWNTGSIIAFKTLVGTITGSGAGYWRYATTTTGTIHPTLADAIGNTNKRDVSVDVTGSVIRAVSLQFSAWTNTTTRAVAVNRSDNWFTFLGFGATRNYIYLGTVSRDGTLGMVDTTQYRKVWNLYNQCFRSLSVCPAYNNNGAGATYTHTGTSYTELNSGTNARVIFVHGMKGGVDVTFNVDQPTGATGASVFGIGVNSTVNTPRAVAFPPTTALTGSCRYAETMAEGEHFLAMCGRVASGTATLQADRAPGGGSTDPYSTYLDGGLFG